METTKMALTKMTPLREHEEFEALLRPRRATEESFFNKFDPLVCVSFSAKWCGPCQKLDKETIMRKTPGVSWYSVDVDENNVSLGYCSLYKIPSFCFIKDGLFTSKKEGAKDADDVLDWLASNGVPVSNVTK
jgi:thioredoxin-like negative regulator of GroEL